MHVNIYTQMHIRKHTCTHPSLYAQMDVCMNLVALKRDPSKKFEQTTPNKLMPNENTRQQRKLSSRVGLLFKHLIPSKRASIPARHPPPHSSLGRDQEPLGRRAAHPKLINARFSTVPSKTPGLHPSLGRMAQAWLDSSTQSTWIQQSHTTAQTLPLGGNSVYNATTFLGSS